MRRDRFEIVRSIEPGGSVQRSAGALHQLKMLIDTDVFGPLKQHVFEQMREACPPFALVSGTNMVPEIDRHDRRRAVFGERNSKTVVETVRVYRNVHCE